MVLDKPLKGKFVNLRSVTEDDAEFILQIRNDPQISKYLPSLNITVEQQKAWIRKQREDNESYYFVIENKAAKMLGTISVYDIDRIRKFAEVGRICSYGCSEENGEAGDLLHSFCFGYLCLSNTTIWVYKDNVRACKYWLKQGYKFDSDGVAQDGRECVYGVRKERLENYQMNGGKYNGIA